MISTSATRRPRHAPAVPGRGPTTEHTQAGGVRDRRHRADGVPVVLPRRRGPRRVGGERHRRGPGLGPAAGAVVYVSASRTSTHGARLMSSGTSTPTRLDPRHRHRLDERRRISDPVVTKKWGLGTVAQIITFGTIKAKAGEV